MKDDYTTNSHYPTYSIHFCLKGWQNVLFELGIKRLNVTLLFVLPSQGSGAVRWKFVHGLFENAIYGGRIDNTFDAKVLLSYLLKYFDQSVFAGQVSRTAPDSLGLSASFLPV